MMTKSPSFGEPPPSLEVEVLDAAVRSEELLDLRSATRRPRARARRRRRGALAGRSAPPNRRRRASAESKPGRGERPRRTRGEHRSEFSHLEAAPDPGRPSGSRQCGVRRDEATVGGGSKRAEGRRCGDGAPRYDARRPRLRRPPRRSRTSCCSSCRTTRPSRPRRRARRPRAPRRACGHRRPRALASRICHENSWQISLCAVALVVPAPTLGSVLSGRPDCRRSASTGGGDLVT